MYLRELFALSISNPVHKLEIPLLSKVSQAVKRWDVRPVRMDFGAYLSTHAVEVCAFAFNVVRV